MVPATRALRRRPARLVSQCALLGAACGAARRRRQQATLRPRPGRGAPAALQARAVQPRAERAAAQELAQQPAVLRRLQARACRAPRASAAAAPGARLLSTPRRQPAPAAPRLPRRAVRAPRFPGAPLLCKVAAATSPGRHTSRSQMPGARQSRLPYPNPKTRDRGPAGTRGRRRAVEADDVGVPQRGQRGHLAQEGRRLAGRAHAHRLDRHVAAAPGAHARDAERALAQHAPQRHLPRAAPAARSGPQAPSPGPCPAEGGRCGCRVARPAMQSGTPWRRR